MTETTLLSWPYSRWTRAPASHVHRSEKVLFSHSKNHSSAVLLTTVMEPKSHGGAEQMVKTFLILPKSRNNVETYESSGKERSGRHETQM